MKIGIIVAMKKELALLKPLLRNPVIQEFDGQIFHSGYIGNHEVTAMQCGIGKVNAAIGTVALIGRFNPELVINTGVAGGADKTVNVMDLVVGERVAYHDVWCGPESPWGMVQGLPLFYSGDTRLINLLPKRDDIKVGLIASGDRFVDSIEAVQKIKKNFSQALAVDMESGAIAQTCEIKKTPFLSMRVISDSPGASHNNTQQYIDFWEEAPQHTFELLHRLLLTL